MASNPLGQLIADIALDSSVRQAYVEDPEPVIDAAGLSDTQEQALRSGDWQRIVQELDAEGNTPLPFPEPDGDSGGPPP